MQVTPFGLQILDPNWLPAAGAAAPSLRAVAATDANAFAVGDIVRETGASIDGIHVVSSALPQPGPGGLNYTPVGGISAKLGAKPLIVVAVSPVLPAGPKGSTGLVWVLEVGNREFLIAGDASTPARGEWPGPEHVPLNLFASNVNNGETFASLRYGAPSASVSGTSLDGTSFVISSAGGRGELHVLGLANGSQLGPHALYRVRFRDFG